MSMQVPAAVGMVEAEVATPATSQAVARWNTGLTLVQAILSGVAFVVLGDAFGFPDILREPAAVALPRFQEHAATIRQAYYAFTLSYLLVIPIAVLLRGLLARRATILLDVATVLGIASGFAQTLGFIRWPIAIPYFAETYTDPTTSDATRAAVAAAYESLNRWQGMAIGEHLGWLLQGSWTLLLGVALVRHAALPRWLGLLGVVIGIGLLIGTGEQFQAGGEPALNLVNAVATTAAQVWLVVLAIVLLRQRLTEATDYEDDRA